MGWACVGWGVQMWVGCDDIKGSRRPASNRAVGQRAGAHHTPAATPHRHRSGFECLKREHNGRLGDEAVGDRGPEAQERGERGHREEGTGGETGGDWGPRPLGD